MYDNKNRIEKMKAALNDTQSGVIFITYSFVELINS